MRIWGYIILGLGVVFLILLGLAAAGGAHLSVVSVIVVVILMSTGWSLVRSGKGILQTVPSAGGAAQAAATGQPADQAAAPATVQLPLTPAIAAVVLQKTARMRRILLYLAGGCVVFFGGLGALLGFTDSSQSEGRAMFAVFAGVGLVSAVMIYGISWLTSQAPVRRDLREKNFLRTTGPVQVVPIVGGYMLRLSDRAFLMNGRDGALALAKISFCQIDYTPHGHVILGAWDQEGKSVYCLPGYSGEQ
jgi:hypothetical protein